MKKSSVLLICSVTLLLVRFAPPAQAWGWITHRGVVKVAYDELPAEIRARLDWDAIYDGSTLPDRDHSYHQSTGAEWLERAREDILKGDYYNASLALGVASHLIADDVALPHCESVWSIINYDEHSEFENQGKPLSPARPCLISNFDLEQALKEYSDNALDKWQEWTQTSSTSIVQEGVDLAASYTFNAWYQVLETVPVAEPIKELLLWCIAGIATVCVASAAVIVVRRGHVQWYIYQNGKKYGPVNAKLLCKWIGESRVKGDTLVWRKSMEGWRKIEEIESFKSSFH